MASLGFEAPSGNVTAALGGCRFWEQFQDRFRSQVSLAMIKRLPRRNGGHSMFRMRTSKVLGPGNTSPTRYSLLSRLQDWNDHGSWMDFFGTYRRLIYSTAIKSGLTESEAQDALQETLVSVAKDIGKFRRDRTLGSFKAWLRNIVRRRVVDQFRKRPLMGQSEPATMNESYVQDLEQIPDPNSNSLESLWDMEWRMNLFQAAADRVKRQVKEEHFQIFDLYVTKGWPVSKVARILDTNVGRVYLIKCRISALIKREIQMLEKSFP